MKNIHESIEVIKSLSEKYEGQSVAIQHEIGCKTCILLPLCLEQVIITDAPHLPLGYSIYISRWGSKCYTTSTHFLEVKEFFLKQKGYIREE